MTRGNGVAPPKRAPEVAEWLFERGTLSREDVVEARVVKEANCHLESASVADDNFVRRLEAVEGA